nr:hypothetical protein GCM10020185_16770 [Pseudomonas brassicacearum subsp. brassicacearum]
MGTIHNTASPVQIFSNAQVAQCTYFGTLHSWLISPPILNVRFFRTDAGNEPVREWLTDLPREHRRMIGTDIKTVQIGWPIGMPVVRKLDTGLWEVRIDLGDTIARVLFTVVGSDMVLLHAFIKKKSKKRQPPTWQPPSSAKQDYEAQQMNKHIGSDFDDFLAEQGIAEEVSAAALKRVIAWQIAEAMRLQKVTKKSLGTADAHQSHCC